MCETILNGLGIDVSSCENINPNDAFLYSLIFAAIGKNIDILKIANKLTDEEVLEIHNSLMASVNKELVSTEDKDACKAILNTKNHIEVIVKNMTSKSALERESSRNETKDTLK